MSLIKKLDPEKSRYFLPHHAVFREESLTIKIRVVFDGGGRLKTSDLNEDAKHPLILDSKHKLTQLIFEHEHSRLLNLSKQTVRKCLKCFKYKPKPLT